MLDTATIERDERIQFHEQGTLTAVTRWVSGHDEGVAEWLKNARRAYQADRANVQDQHRVAVLLMRNATASEHARIGLLDVGGATLEDVELWSTWQDPNAASRGFVFADEENQGNGGKAYMFRMFRGVARILGVAIGRLNCKGFDGPEGSVLRGTPGFIPSAAAGRDLPIASVETELQRALAPYGITSDDIPASVRQAIFERSSFTLVEGVDPVDLYRGHIVADDLIARTLRHEQSSLAIQQIRVFAMHDGKLLNDGKPYELPPVEPMPSLEGPFVFEIPAELPLESGGTISTIEGGRRVRGRLILQTSRENMQRARKNLRPRWKISYRSSGVDMIGAKPISDFAPSMPGAAYIHGTVELPALSPAYVEHGRRRPKPGPLIDALDTFITERIRELARRVSDLKRQALDDRGLDEVQLENEKLDSFKNKFLPADGGSGGGGNEHGEGRRRQSSRSVEWGEVPEAIELVAPATGIRVASGVQLHLRHLLNTTVVDADGKPVKTTIHWNTSDQSVARFSNGDLIEARTKGRAEVWATVVRGRELVESERVTVEVIVLDHVLLTPRKLTVKLGERQPILAEVTDDEGRRFTDVLLNWHHDADNPLIVRVGPRGILTGGRIGRTAVFAGGRGPGGAEVWSRIPVEVDVVDNPKLEQGGEGFPRLLVTGRDIDPNTGQIRQGDPDSPVLWQEPSDFVYNVWWLNVESPEALFAFSQRDTNPSLWRLLHASVVVDLVVQVHMQTQFTRKGDRELPDLWSNHRNAIDLHRVSAVQAMWEELEPYVREGAELVA
jgi:hypothetical protein